MRSSSEPRERGDRSHARGRRGRDRPATSRRPSAIAGARSRRSGRCSCATIFPTRRRRSTSRSARAPATPRSFTCTRSKTSRRSSTSASRDGHVFSHALRVDKVVERLEVHAPEISGWLRKEVKLKPQRLDKEYVTEPGRVRQRDASSRCARRSRAWAPATTSSYGRAAPRVSLTRVGEGAELPAFDLTDEDETRMVDSRRGARRRRRRAHRRAQVPRAGDARRPSRSPSIRRRERWSSGSSRRWRPSCGKSRATRSARTSSS